METILAAVVIAIAVLVSRAGADTPSRYVVTNELSALRSVLQDIATELRWMRAAVQAANERAEREYEARLDAEDEAEDAAERAGRTV